MDNIEKKHKKIGRNTFGIVMIIFGILLLIQMFVKIDILRLVLYIYPLVFISFGIETLVYSYKKNIETKFDVSAIILTILLLGFGIIFALVNLGVNKVLYDSKFKETAINYRQNQTFNNTFKSDSVKIVNLCDKSINVKIQEYSENEVISVKGKIKYNKESLKNSYFNILNNTLESPSELFNIDHEKNIVMLSDYPENVENIELIILTQSRDKVKLEGKIDIK